METIKDLGEPLAEKLRIIAKSKPQTLHEVVARTTAASNNAAASAAAQPAPPAQAPAAD